MGLTYKQEYYQRNKIEIARKKREYRQKNLEKVREQERQARLRNPETHKKAINRRVQKIRSRLAKLKTEQGCRVCGEQDPRCLDFHHRNPETKEFNISTCATRAWRNIELEISKCVVLCSNCHRKLHWSLLGEVEC